MPGPTFFPQVVLNSVVLLLKQVLAMVNFIALAQLPKLLHSLLLGGARDKGVLPQR